MANSNIDFLTSLKENDSVMVNQTATDWEDAIKKCFVPLIEKGRIKPSYVDSVIRSTKEFGPYYIICPKVAMPHTRPEDGALDNAFSLMTLEKPVLFDNQEVFLIIGFAAIDANTHLEIALPQIVGVFENPEVTEIMLKAKDKTEIISIIEKIDYSKYMKK